MTASIWDNPELAVGGDYVKFENIGDTITGVINAIRAHRFDDGKVAPQILLTTPDGEEKTVSAGQVRLKVALAEQRPEAGDTISITLTDIEKRAGGKTLKHFTVNVQRGTGAAPATAVAPPAAAPTPAGVDPSVAAALANLTPEQRVAMGLPAS